MPWYDPTSWGKKSHQGVSLGVWMPTVQEPFGINTYQAFAFEGYKRNSTAFQCVNLIARAIADLPIKIFTERPTSDGTEEVMALDHPLWRFIGPKGRPNAGQSWLKYNQAYWAYRHISGNEYLFALGDENMPGEFRLLRPDRMEPIKGTKVQPITGWKHTVNGIEQIIPAEQILHTSSFDPLSDMFGMPIFEPCAAEIDQDNAAGLWNYSLLRNGGRPSLLFTTPEGQGPPSPEQIKMIERWEREKVAGPANAGKGLIGPGLKVTEVGKSPKDMDWLKGMIQAKVAIANVCGVPPELIGIQDQKTYSNYETARRAFYEETILPYADDMFKSLTKFLGSRFQTVRGGPMSVIIAVDRESVVALQENQDSKHTRIREDVGGPFITVNEGRDAVGLDDVEGGDEILVQASKQPLELVAGGEPDNEIMPENLPIPVETEEDEDAEE